MNQQGLNRGRHRHGRDGCRTVRLRRVRRLERVTRRDSAGDQDALRLPELAARRIGDRIVAGIGSRETLPRDLQLQVRVADIDLLREP